nr:hypothetical protein [Specibacter cremeus]
MYKKLRTLETIDRSGAVLIVRLDNEDLAERVAEAAIAGGFQALEITLSIPGAVEVIRRLSGKHGPHGVAVGAGTVLDEHSAYECIRAGADFLVSPQLNPAMIRMANRYQVPTISGAYTPTELVETPPWRTFRSCRQAASPPAMSPNGLPPASPALASAVP